MCDVIAKNSKENDDEKVYEMICYCAQSGWVQELRLALELPRSSVEFHRRIK